MFLSLAQRYDLSDHQLIIFIKLLHRDNLSNRPVEFQEQLQYPKFQSFFANKNFAAFKIRFE